MPSIPQPTASSLVVVLTFIFIFIYLLFCFARRLNSRVLPLDMAAVCGGQPLQMMLKDQGSGGHVLALDVWHERLQEQQEEQ
jgi:hypothetical protein